MCCAPWPPPLSLSLSLPRARMPPSDVYTQLPACPLHTTAAVYIMFSAENRALQHVTPCPLAFLHHPPFLTQQQHVAAAHSPVDHSVNTSSADDSPKLSCIHPASVWYMRQPASQPARPIQATCLPRSCSAPCHVMPRRLKSRKDAVLPVPHQAALRLVACRHLGGCLRSMHLQDGCSPTVHWLQWRSISAGRQCTPASTGAHSMRAKMH